MIMAPGFLAGAFRIAEENSIRALIPAGSTVAQIPIYVGALLVVALAVFAWAAFFRRQRQPRRHSHHHHHHRHRSRSASRHSQPAEAPARPRTLAETGGLPPLRSQQPPPAPD
jgi:hypothetical protein